MTGYYTTTFPFLHGSHSQRHASPQQTKCEPGFYCVQGVRTACPAGSFGNTSGLSTSSCSGLCPLGYYCPGGTNQPVPCPEGTYGATKGLQDARCTDLCPIGFYCESATVTPNPCPSGTFGRVRGLTSRDCSANCTMTTDRGYYCPLATTTPTPCGSVSVYCPTGSRLPVTVTTGYYTVWQTFASSARDDSTVEDGYLDGGALASINQTTRVAQRICEAGSYCINGVKRLCPPGVYGSQSGLATALCSGACPAGYFCQIGSSDYASSPCLDATLYCRQGSSVPSTVSTGYFTVTGNRNTRIDQTICPPGSYCTGGVAYLCPAGTYGDKQGLSTPACSGWCQDGYICPEGSTSVTQSPCPAGTYSQNGLFCSPCLPGYWCEDGSPDPKQHECGADDLYCPLGSDSASVVLDGYFAVGQTVSTHTTQQQCTLQTVAHIPQCPMRTAGANSDA
ncbi:TPA: hypothetical protein N0F65_002268 [Lagenidium giganteum]|uniref:Uncharacterized protein n=1 Tax=Lagenidium giganteum TaxID=4803 RepID=A0AAV2YSP2_9STRA|nr:TPA: hypothetical protein N0F65_002268 [Lagenidium giganteum]